MDNITLIIIIIIIIIMLPNQAIASTPSGLLLITSWASLSNITGRSHSSWCCVMPTSNVRTTARADWLAVMQAANNEYHRKQTTGKH
jgi:hypothetical protein